MALRGASLGAALVALLFHACQAHVDANVLVQDASEDVEVELEETDDDVTNLMQETILIDRHRGSKVRPDANGGWFFYAIRAAVCVVVLLAPALLQAGFATGVVDNFNLARSSVGAAVSGGATFLGTHGRSLSAQGKDFATAVPADVLDAIDKEDEPCCDFAFVPGLQRSAELIPANEDGDVTDDLASALMAQVEEELSALGSMSRLQNHAELREASTPSKSQVADDVVDALVADAEHELGVLGSMSRLQEEAEIDFISSESGSQLSDEVVENIMSKLSSWLDKPTKPAADDELTVLGSMSRVQRKAVLIPAGGDNPAIRV